MEVYAMDAKRRIERARTKLLLRHPFWGSLALHLELSEANESVTNTLATDGRHLFFNPEFVTTLNDDELIGVVAHETGHCALGHVWRRGERNPAIWNIAADHAVNYILKHESGFILPEGALDAYPKEFAESIYKKLGSKTRTKKQGWCDGSKELWTKSAKEDDEPGIMATDQQTWADLTAQAAEGPGQGTTPGSMSSIIGELKRPQVDWKSLLADMIYSAVPSDFSMNPNKRHVWRNIYLPSTRREGVELAVAVDTSGSVSQDTLTQFMSECHGIAEAFGDFTIHFYAADAEINGYWTVTQTEDMPVDLPGRGGTDFRPVFKDIEERGLEPTCLVYLTDAYGPFPRSEPDYPVIWVVVNNGGRTPWGSRVEVND